MTRWPLLSTCWVAPLCQVCMIHSFDMFIFFPSSVRGSSHRISVFFGSRLWSQCRNVSNNLLSSSVCQIYATSSPPKWCRGDPKYLSTVETRLVICSYVWRCLMSSWAVGCFRSGVPITKFSFHKPLECCRQSSWWRILDRWLDNVPYVTMPRHVCLWIDKNTQSLCMRNHTLNVLGSIVFRSMAVLYARVRQTTICRPM